MKSVLAAIVYALDNIRTNLFHTLLSVLGLIIGVSALIAMLSMIDGLEKYAKDMIQQTTTLKLVQMSTNTVTRINDISIRKDNPVILTEEIYSEVIDAVHQPSIHFRASRMGKEVVSDTNSIGTTLYYTDKGYTGKYPVEHGENLFNQTGQPKGKYTVVNADLARRMADDPELPQEVIGRKIDLNEEPFEIIGIVSGSPSSPEMLVPIQFLPADKIADYPPFIVFEADHVEDVPEMKKALEQWVADSQYEPDDFTISTQEFRVEQATRGFILFRIVMGMIIGIAVVVGGVGVMNVMLISVTQRTNEIGLRKAAGAQKRDIFNQFLTESILVSLFGTLLGIITGILISLAVNPIVFMITEIRFTPVFSASSILFITLVSMFIGILFGTFPAYKASRLDPILAIQRE